MEIELLLQSLLSAARSEQFESVRSLPGAGIHSQVRRLADHYRDTLIDFFSKLDTADRGCFVKSVAVYEDSAGGLGSVTTLHRLLSLLSDPDHAVLNWILANTKSYLYYSEGARSFAELQEAHRIQANRRAESQRKEEERAAAAQTNRAARATLNLFNAVRRGDTKAVAALLNQGADPNSTTPEGVPLQQYAVSVGHTEIARLLNGESIDRNAP
jgi:hypothetical protein